MIDDKEYFDPNIKKTFFKKYLSYLFPIKKKISFLNTFVFWCVHIGATLFSLVFSLFYGKMIGGGGFSISVFIFSTMLVNFIVIKLWKYYYITEQRKNEKKLEFNREDMLFNFLANDLPWREVYLENKSFNKNQLSEFINFIQENLNQEEIMDVLESNYIEDITEPNSLYSLLIEAKEKIESEQCMAYVNKEKEIKMKNIKKVFSSFKKQDIKEKEKV